MHVLHEVVGELSETDTEDVLKTLDDTDIHASCSSALLTGYKRKQYFEENFAYVHPRPAFGGFDENRKEQYAQYIPIKDTVTALLKDDRCVRGMFCICE